MGATRRAGTGGGLQLPLWDPASTWSPPSLSDLPSWRGARRVGIDVETRDPNIRPLGPGVRRDGRVVGFSFAIEDGPAHYVPLAHQGGDNVENPEAALRYLRDQCRQLEGEVVGAHLPYDLDYLWELGVEFPKVSFYRDVQVADPLICELHQRYSLEAIAQRWGLPGKEEEGLREAARHYNVDPKFGLWQLPARFVGEYATRDAVLPLQILRRQEEEIEQQDLWEVFDLESRVLPVLVRMRRRGVRVSQERLEQVELWSLDQEREALEKVHHLTGHCVSLGDVWKPGAIAPALEAVGVSLGRTSTGQPQIDKDLLDRVDHPVAEALSWARKTNKLRTTFAASVRRHMVRGRIHCTFNQLRRTDDRTEGTRGAAYGRLSSENPNMQQQPARDEFAKMWRSIYLPEEGCLWFSDDFSQQEPRMLVHYAEECRLLGAEKAASRYREDPTTDNHQMMAELTGLPRKQAKNMFLGKCYGMGGAKLSRQLGLPTRWAVFFRDPGRDTLYFESGADAIHTAHAQGGKAFEVAGEEGQAIIDTFDARLPFVRELARKCQRQAERRGYIRTLSGRRCRFPERADGSYDWTHKALNRLIQGGSADQTKKSLVEADEAGHHVQLQVHDEIDGSSPDQQGAREVAEIMVSSYQLRVPFRVDVEVGPSWGEAEAVA